MIYAACHNKASTLGSVLECALRHKNEHLCLDCCEYIAGKIEPRHPVPAIIYDPIGICAAITAL